MAANDSKLWGASGVRKNGSQAVGKKQQSQEATEQCAAVETGGSKRAVYVPGLGMIDDFMVSDNLNECVEALL